MRRILLKFFQHNLITFILLGGLKLGLLGRIHIPGIDRCIKFWWESLRTDGRAKKQTDRRKDG